MKPNLGTTWKDAIQSAYTFGYESWEYSFAEVKDEAREVAEKHGEREAVSFLMNERDWITSEGSDVNELWWAIDEFFEHHMPSEVNEQYKREAAVAEDLHSAFEGGAYDAILGREYDVTKVDHLHE